MINHSSSYYEPLSIFNHIPKKCIMNVFNHIPKNLPEHNWGPPGPRNCAQIQPVGMLKCWVGSVWAWYLVLATNQRGNRWLVVKRPCGLWFLMISIVKDFVISCRFPIVIILIPDVLPPMVGISRPWKSHHGTHFFGLSNYHQQFGPCHDQVLKGEKSVQCQLWSLEALFIEGGAVRPAFPPTE